jgi:DNA-binding SARP family transcriptional activator
MTAGRLALLGGVAAHMAGSASPVTPSRRKAQALLAYLALHAGQAQPRDKLAALLWSEAPARHARHSLRQALLEVRRALPPSGLVEDGETVAIDPGVVEIDITVLERLVATGTPEALEQAAAVYRGDLLEGLGVQDAPFEEWLLAERERLRELALDGLARLLAHRVQTDSRELAIRTALRLLALDPVAESVHRTLMRLYTAAGRRGAALRQYQTCVDTLRRELQAEPEPETRQLYQSLLRVEPSEQTPTIGSGHPVGSAPPSPAHVVPEALLVGRDTERARLREAWEAARTGRGQTLVVTGEAGIGKTRLVADVVAAAAGQGGTVLAGRAYEAEQVLPFGPWVDAIRVGGGLTEAAERLPVGLKRELARLFPDLGAAGPAQGAEHVVRLFEAFAQLLQAGTVARPMLVVLEDLHWADDLSVRFLGFLARRIREWPLFIVGTVRHEDLAGARLLQQVLDDLETERHIVPLAIGPLSRPDAETLVRTLTPVGTDAAVLAQIIDRIWVVSEGNPLVIVETMRGLRDDAGSSAAPWLSVPDRVRRTIAQRLGRLTERERHVAAVAAVIGREVDFALLQRAADVPAGPCAEAVEGLVARRVLHVVGERLEFTHDRIREVAYADLLPPTRRVMHAMVGRALEQAYAGRHGEVADQLARHFVRAEEPDRAVEYLSLTAQLANAAYAFGDAASMLEDALRFVRRLTTDEQDRWVVDLAIRRALAFTMLGRFPETREILLPLRERVERLADPARAGAYWFRLAMTAGYLGNQPEATAFGRAALEAAQACGNEALQGQAHYVLGLASHYRGRPLDGLEHGREAVLFLDRTPDRPWRGLVRLPLALSHFMLGSFDAALEVLAEMEAIGTAIAEPRLRSFAATYSGWVLATRGDGMVAVERCERGVAHAADPVTAALAESRLGQAWLEVGDATRAIPPLVRALAAMDRFRFRPLEAMCAICLGDAQLLAGDPSARGLVERGLASAREDDYRYWVAWAERILARIAAGKGDVEEAETRLEQARCVFAEIPAPFEEARTRLLLAELAWGRGDGEAREVHLKAAGERFVALGAPAYVRRVEALRRNALAGSGAPPRRPERP